MKTQEMKDILFQKLQDEQCNFKKSDISIVKSANNLYNVTIKDYEHIPLRLELELDEFLGYVVYVQFFNGIYYKTIEMFESKKEYDIEHALIHLGYYIGTRF